MCLKDVISYILSMVRNAFTVSYLPNIFLIKKIYMKIRKKGQNKGNLRSIKKTFDF